MYKRLLLVIPVIILTIWLASSLERSYTEPEIISGAMSAAPIHTESLSSEIVKTDAIDEPPTPPETTQPLPETDPDVPSAPDKTDDPPSTTVPIESTTIPEIPIVTEPPPVPETSAIAETTSTPETTASPETTAEPPSPTNTQTATVYWVPNGEVWHTKINCSTLSRSKNILSGTLEAALLAGKERVCKRCG